MHWHALYFPVFLFHNKVSKKKSIFTDFALIIRRTHVKLMYYV